MGTVGDPAGAATQHFDPVEFFKGSLPKLFGLINLTDVTLIVDSDLARMPQVISEFMGRIEALIKEMGRAGTAIADAVTEADAMLASAAARDPAVRAQWKKQAQDAIDAANLAQSGFDGLEDKFKDLVSLVKNQGDSSAGVKACGISSRSPSTSPSRTSRNSRTICRPSWASCCAPSQERSRPSWRRAHTRQRHCPIRAGVV
jgi:hypothetical protein